MVVPPATGLKKVEETSTAPQLFVHSVTCGPVSIENLTVDGNNNRLSRYLLMEGVYFFDASGTVKNVAARNQNASVGRSDV